MKMICRKPHNLFELKRINPERSILSCGRQEKELQKRK